MNNEVYHDGKKYISTKSAALRFGYAHDYVGQLCRSGKVDAKMVGRSWYVSEIAIRNYKSIQLPVSFNLPQNRPLSTKDFPVKYLLDSKPLTPVLATRDWEVEPQKVPSVTVQKIDSVSKRDTPIISPFLKEFAEKTLALAISTSLVISLFTANDINYGGKIHDQLVRGTTTMVKDLQEGAHALASINSMDDLVAMVGKNLPANVFTSLFGTVKTYVASLFVPKETPTVDAPAIAINTPTVSVPAYEPKVVVQERATTKTFTERFIVGDITRVEVDQKFATLNNQLQAQLALINVNSDRSRGSFEKFVSHPAPTYFNTSSFDNPTVSNLNGTFGTLNGSTTTVHYLLADIATTTNFYAQHATFGDTNLLSLIVGALNGPLQANNGVLSATTSVGVLYGGTGLTTAPSYGQVLVGNTLGGYTLGATSTLGFITSDVLEGTNLYYTDARVNAFTHGSSTIPKTYTTNSFTALNTFTSGITSQASSTLAYLSSTYATSTNATSTNLFATNANFTNSTSTFSFATTASSTNLYSQIANLGTLSVLALTSGLATFSQGFISQASSTVNYLSTVFSTSTNATSTNLFATNANFTNSTSTFSFATTASSTNLYSQIANLGTLSVLALTSGLATFSQGFISQASSTVNYLSTVFSTSTNATSTNLFATNANFTNSTSTFSFATTASSTNLYSQIANLGTLSVLALTSGLATFSQGFISQASSTVNYLSSTYATSTNATSTNLFATNANFTNSTSTFSFATTASSTNLYSQIANLGTLSVLALTSGLATFSQGFISQASSTVNYLSSTYATSTNATSTNLFATNANFTNSTSTFSFATTASSTNLYSQIANLGTLSVLGLTTFTGGNVGIGSTSPSSLFAVNGNAYTSGTSFFGGAITATSTFTVAGITNSGILTNTSNGTSTFSGGLSAAGLLSNNFIEAQSFKITSTTATSMFAGNLTLGTNLSNYLTVNSSISSNLIPDGNNTRNLGSPSNYWNNGYVDTLSVNTLSAGNTSINGTISSSFVINSDNVSADGEDSSLIFHRGSLTNAVILWDHTLDQFNFNNALTVTGNLGVGTTSPYQPLSVTASGGKSAYFAGNVGIGTSNPSFPLAISLDTSGNDSLRITSTSHARIGLESTASNGNLWTIYSADDGSLQLYDTTRTKYALISNPRTSVGIFMDTNGNLGIGSTSPSSLFAVNGNAYTSGTSFFGGAITGTSSLMITGGTSTIAYLSSTYATSTNATSTNLFATNANFTNSTSTFSFATTASSTNLYSQIANLGTLSVLGLTTFTGGNVGIGTTSPSSLFAVNGNAYTSGTSFFGGAITGTSSLMITGGTSTIAYLSSTYATSTNATSTNLFATNANFTNSTSTFSFATTASSTNLYSQIANLGTLSVLGLTTFTGGNVGIGTTAPGAKFHLNRDDTTRTDFFIENNDLSSNAEIGIIRFDALDSGSGTQAYAAITGMISSPTAGAAVGRIDFETAVASSVDKRVSIVGGNVGIGTTSPANTLSVQGNSYVSGTSFFGGAITATSTLNVTGLTTLGYASTTQISSTGSAYFATTGGNVGIGTTSPGVALDVIGSSSGSLRLSDASADATNKLGRIIGRPFTNIDTNFLAFDIRGLTASNEINYGGGSGILNAATLHRFYTAATKTTLTGTEQLRIDNNGVYMAFNGGNVGIGTTSPYALLSVSGGAVNNGTTSNAPIAVIANTNTGTGVSYVGLDFANNEITTGAQYRRAQIFAGYGGTSNISGFLAMSTANTSGALSERLRINENGNVGIGTTSPNYKLTVAGGVTILDVADTRFTSNSNSITTGIAGLTSQLTDSTGTTQGRFHLAVSAGPGTAHLSTASQYDVYLTTSGAGTTYGNILFATGNSEKMRIASSTGYVGIGTTAPGYKLEVNGQVAVNSDLVLMASGVAKGYIFGSGDNLYIRALDTKDIVFQESGSTMVTMKGDTGNVGIGTTTPNRPFAIQSTASDIMIVANYSADSNPNISIQNDVQRWAMQTVGARSDNFEIVDLTNSSSNPRLVVTAITGYVGIGTTTPNQLMTVYGANAAQSADGQTAGAVNLAIYSSDSAAADKGGSLGFGGYYTGTTAQNLFGRISGRATNTSGGGYLAFETTNGNSTTPAERMRIDMSGNVGIGTTSPGSILSVNNVANFQTGTSTLYSQLRMFNGSAGIDLTTIASDSANINFLASDQSVRGRISAVRANTVSEGIGFSFNPVGTGYSEVLSVIETGNVGIGTTSPASLFSVAGNGYFTGNVGIGTAGPHAPLEVVGRAIASNLVVGPYANLNDTTGVANTLQFGNNNASAFVSGSADAYVYKTVSSAGSVYPFTVGNSGSLVFQLRGDQAAGNFVFAGGSTPASLMTIQSGGNVGIGTTGPLAKLHIDDGSTTKNNVAMILSHAGYSSADGASTEIVLGALSAAAGHATLTGARIKSIEDYSSGYGVGLSLQYRTNANVLTDGLTINKLGNVGIGTTTPIAKLHVTSGGSGLITPDSEADDLVVESSGVTGISLLNPDSSKAHIYFGSPSDTAGAEVSYDPNNSLMTIGTLATSNYLRFNSGNGVEAMRLTSGGNVGIGTTSPQATLGIAGSLGVSSTHLVLSAGGNVGIGVSPANDFNLAHTAAGGSVIAVFENLSNTATSHGIVYTRVGGTSAGDPKNIFSITGGGTWSIGADNTDSDSFKIAASTELETSTALTILTGGNVGIGTTSPASLFSVAGNGYFTGNVGIGISSPEYALDVSKTSVGANLDLLVRNRDNTNTSSGARNMVYVAGSSAGDPRFVAGITGIKEWSMGIDNDDSDSFKIGEDSVVGSNTRLTIQVGGNVGIGTTSPQGLLSVGSGQLTVPSGSQTAPGYTFNDDLNTGLYRDSADSMTFTAGGTNLLVMFNNAAGLLARVNFQAVGGTGATSPSLTFGSDNDTGFFNPSANNLGITTGGTERIRIDSSGNVGIGTTTPNRPFAIQSTASDIMIVANYSADSNPNISIQNDVQRWAMQTVGARSDNFEIVDLTNSSSNPRLVVTAITGNVGIGTTSPTSLLSVAGGSIRVTSSGGDGVRFQSNSATSDKLGLIFFNNVNTERWRIFNDAGGNLTDDLQFISNANGTNVLTLLQGGNVGIGSDITPDASLEIVKNGSVDPLYITNSTDGDLFVVKNGGNVGIGTTTPGARLSVQGNSLISGTTTTSGLISTSTTLLATVSGNVGIGTTAPGAKFETYSVSSGLTWNGMLRNDYNANATGYGVGLKLKISTSDGPNEVYKWAGIAAVAGSAYSNRTDLALYAAPNSTSDATEKVRIQGDGNVGIGTTSPAALLAVQGNEYVTGKIGVGTSDAANATAAEFVGSANSVVIRNTSSTSYGGLRFYNDQNSAVRAMEIDYTGSAYASAFLTNGISGEQGSITTVGAYPLSIGTNNTQRMTIASGGNVGIGTTGPLGTLHVKTGGTAIATAGGDSASDVMLEGASKTFGGSITSNLAIISNDSQAIDLGGSMLFGGKYSGNSFAYFGMIRGGKLDGVSGNYGGYLALGGRATGGSVAEVMRITGSNVGIGTTSPGSKLAVSGDIEMGGGNTTFKNTSGFMQIGTVGNYPTYLGANNNLQVVTISTAGNVGIGTTGPDYLLDVGTDARAAATMIDVNADWNYDIGYIISANGAVQWKMYEKAATNDLRFFDGVGDRVTFQDGGNVGIGTTSPTQKLVVSGGAISLDNGQALNFNDTGGTSRRTVLVNSTNMQFGDTDNTGFNTFLYSGTSNALTFQNGAVVAMTLKTGNVGIGTTSPYSKFAVADNTNGVNTPIFVLSNTETNGYPEIRLQSDSRLWGMTNFTDDSFRIVDRTADLTRVTIDTNGNVGVGTAAPSYKFVVSNAGASGLEVAPGLDMAGNSTAGSVLLQGYNRSGSAYSTMEFSALAYKFGIAGAEKVAILNSGNVGIGTTAPGAKLHVENDTTDTIATFYEAGLANADYKVIRLGKSSATNESGALEFKYDSGGSSLIALGLYGDSFGTGLVQKKGGNVGIGTTVPTAKLQIANTSAGAAAVALFLNNASNTASTETRLAFAANANDDIATGRYSYISALNTSGSNGQALTFATNITGASATEKMRITDAGNVGIGTTSPNGILTIARDPGGNTGIEGLRIANIYSGQTGFGDMRFIVGTDATGGAIIFAANPTLGTGGSVSSLTKQYPSGARGGAALEVSNGNFLFHTVDSSNTYRQGMTFANTGNLGIGTTSPYAKFSLHALTSDTQTGPIFDVSSSTPTATTSLMVISRTGNVGIGTTAPVETFDVSVGAIKSVRLLLDSTAFNPSPITASTDGSDAVLAAVSGNTAGGSDSQNASSLVLQSGIGTGSGSNGDIIFKLASNTVNGGAKTRHGGPSTYMTIKSVSGNVGIGTTSPAALFAVGGAGYFTGNVGIGVSVPTTQNGNVSTIFHMRGANNIVTNIDTTSTTVDQGAIFESTFSGQTSGTTRGSQLGFGRQTSSLSALSTNMQFLTTSAGTLAERMRLNAAGNLGIGTTTPQALLHVEGGSGNTRLLVSQSGSIGSMAAAFMGVQVSAYSESTGVVRFKDTGANAANNEFFVIENTSASNNVAAGLFNVKNNGGSVFRIQHNGNVGIGTTSPTAKLEVFTTTDGISEAVRFGHSSAGANQGALIRFTNLHASGDTPNTGEYNTAGIIGYDYDSNWGGALAFQTATAGNFGGEALSTKMTITPTGNVGIGTTTPNGLVVGGGTFLNVDGTGGGGIAMHYTNATAYGELSLFKGINGSFIDSAGAATQANQDIIFRTGRTASSFAVTEAMRIQASSGNVGIGDTTPDYKLEVDSGAGGNIFSSMGLGRNTTSGFATITFDTGSVNQWMVGLNGSIAADNKFRFWKDGYGEVLTLDTTGNVGIGTTTPGARLSVQGNSLISGTTTTSGLISTSTTLLATVSGNVGIGTANPTSGYKLDVIGNVRLGVASPTLVLTNTSGTSYGLIDIDTNTSAQTTRLGVEQAGGGALFTGSSAYASVFGSRGASSVQFATGGTVQMTILNGGNVGIGTAAPLGKLQIGDVDGQQHFLWNSDLAQTQYPSLNVSITADNSTDGPHVVGLELHNRSEATNAWSPVIAFSVNSSGASNHNPIYAGIAGQNMGNGPNTDWEGGDLTFWTAGLGGSTYGPTEKMRVTSTGNLGIGTTSPRGLLHVAGATSIFGAGELGTPTATTIRGAIAAGSNISGADFTIGGTTGTGTASPGALVFKTGSIGITYDSVSSSNTVVSVNNISWSHTVGTASNRYLVVGVHFSSPSGYTVSTATYAGVSMTRLGCVAVHGNNYTACMYGLAAPATGSNTVAVTMTASVSGLAVGATSWSGVNQTIPTSAYTSTTGTNSTPSLTVSSATDEIVVDALTHWATAASNVTGGQTERYNLVNAQFGTGEGSSLVGASSAVMSWNLSGGAANWAIGAVALKPAVSGSTPNNAGTATVAQTLSEKMRIDANGNMALGTSTPNNKLTIFSATNSALEFAGASGAGANWTMGIDAADGMKFKIASSTAVGTNTRLTINTSGNVGIGTTAPLTTLVVASTTDSAAQNGVLWLQDSDGLCKHDPESGSETVSCSSDARLKTNIVNAAPVLSYLSGLPIRDYTVITSGDHKTGVIAQELLSSYSELVSMGSDSYYSVAEVSSWKLIKGIQEIVQRIDLGNAPTTTPSIYIDATGNIGIGLGTTTPAYKLQVLGDVAAQSFVNISTRDSKKNITYKGDSDKSSIYEKIKNIKIADYRYLNESSSAPLHLGLIAEEAPTEVLSVDGKGVDVYKLASFTILGVQEIQKRLDALDVRVTKLELMASMFGTTTPVMAQNAEGSASSTVAVVVGYLKDAVTSIKSLFVSEIHVQDKLCVDDVCINKDQLKALLIQAGGTIGVSSPTPTPVVIPATTSTSTPEVATSTSSISSGQASSGSSTQIFGSLEPSPTSTPIPSTSSGQEASPQVTPTPSSTAEQATSAPTETISTPTVIEVPAPVADAPAPAPVEVPAPSNP